MPALRDGGVSDFREPLYLMDRVGMDGGAFMTVRLDVVCRVFAFGYVRFSNHLHWAYQATKLHEFLRQLTNEGHSWFLEDGTPGSEGFDRDPVTVPALPFVKLWEAPLRRYRW